MANSYVPLLKKRRTIALLLLCGAVGAMVLYDQGFFLSGRNKLISTYVISRIGLTSGLGDKLGLPQQKDTLYSVDDIFREKAILIIEEYITRNEEPLVEWRNKYDRTILGFKDKDIAIIKTKIASSPIHNVQNIKIIINGFNRPTFGCRWSPDMSMISCLQHKKDVVLFDAKTGEETQRYTYPGGGPGSNFDKMEWLSEDELVLLDDRFSKTYEKNILRLNINTGVIVPVCDSDVRSHLENGVIKEGHKGENILCSDLPEFAVLFGSREWPVQEKYPSDGPEGDRFYFYPRWIPGPWLYPGKTWIEGYDRETGDTFYVATIDSILKSIFGDSFIVDWFGWQTVL